MQQLPTSKRNRFVAVPPGKRPATVALAPHPDGRSAPRARRAMTRDEAASFGSLAPFVADGEVTDLFVNGPNSLYVDRGEGAALDPDWATVTDEALRALAVRIIARGGRHLDEAEPCVDVRIGDGIRVHAVLPPVSTGGTLLSIRLPRTEPPTMGELRDRRVFGPGIEATLRAAVAARTNLLITGAGGSGKTTLLAALLACAEPGDRIVTMEDVAELRIAHPHVIGLESRQANIEGAGEVGLPRLVREALRMRPDRLVLGECRGAELRDLLAALNTGHDGGAGTLHANSLADVPSRLEALGALARLDPQAVARQAVSAIGLVVHVERRGGRRRVAELGEFGLAPDGRLSVAPIRPGGAGAAGSSGGGRFGGDPGQSIGPADGPAPRGGPA
ncbi:MAG: TadA family conjugal transfer-associated ATPase [Pseudoclavibacter sp.]